MKRSKKKKTVQERQKVTGFGDIEVGLFHAKVPDGTELHPKVYSCKSGTTSADVTRTKKAEKRKEIARRKAAARKMRRSKQVAKETNLIRITLPSSPKPVPSSPTASPRLPTSSATPAPSPSRPYHFSFETVKLIKEKIKQLEMRDPEVALSRQLE